MMMTIRHVVTGDRQFVSSMTGIDPALWEATGEPVPTDLATQAYRNQGGIIVAVPPVPRAPVTAYELAVARGFVGTEAQWLASLVGPAAPVVTPSMKPADEARASATLANDAALTWPVVANAVYRVDLFLLFSPSAITAGGKWALVGPAGAVLAALETTSASTVATFGLGTARAVTMGALSTYRVSVDGILITGANAGALTLQWAQNTLVAPSPTTLKRGSILSLARIA